MIGERWTKGDVGEGASECSPLAARSRRTLVVTAATATPAGRSGPRATRSCSRRRRTRRSSTPRSSPTASRSASRTRSSRASSASSRARRSSHPEARDELDGERRRQGLDVQAPQGREVPRRDAVQRGGGLLQLQPLVQLPGARSRTRRLVLLQHGVRRLRAPAAGSPGPTRRSTRAARRSARLDGASSPCSGRSRPFLGALALHGVRRCRARPR